MHCFKPQTGGVNDDAQLKTIAKHLAEVKHMGKFAAGGLAGELPLPGLWVDPVGDISVPLTEEQSQALIAVGERAPYGRGEETLVDSRVRQTWQFLPNRIQLRNPNWETSLSHLLARIKLELGCPDQPADLRLYRLLLYAPGDHFALHRDSEKDAGMFGTVIVQLPSRFTGGALVVQHGGETRRFDCTLEGLSPFNCFFAALYADCEHQLEEVASGYRLALVYSLCWKGPPGRTLPSAASHSSHELCRVLGAAITARDAATDGRPFFVLLDHAYTEATLGHHGEDALKGRDRAIVVLLQSVSEGLPEDQQLDLHFVRVDRTVIADIDSDDSDDSEDSDLPRERQTSLSHWMTLGGQPLELGGLRFEAVKDLVVDSHGTAAGAEERQPRWQETREPEEQHTGNEGTSRTHWYHCYAVAVWPRRRTVALRCQGGNLLGLLGQVRQKADAALLRVVLQVCTETPKLLATDCKDDTKVAKGAAEAIAVVGASHLQLELAALRAALLEHSPDALAALAHSLADVSEPSAQDFVLAATTSLAEQAACLGEGGLVTVLGLALRQGAGGPLTDLVTFLTAKGRAPLLGKVLHQTQPLFDAQPPLKVMPQVQQLVDRRVRWLRKATRAPPELRWERPDERVPEHPQVEAFLRSSEKTFVYQNFNNLPHARNWANKHLLGGYSSSLRSSGAVDATGVPGGMGKTAYVTITKQKRRYELQLQLYEAHLKELERWAEFQSDTEPPAKRARREPHSQDVKEEGSAEPTAQAMDVETSSTTVAHVVDADADSPLSAGFVEN